MRPPPAGACLRSLRAGIVLATVALTTVSLAPDASATNGAMAWGSNDLGQLGIGTLKVPAPGGQVSSVYSPMAVGGLIGVQSISAGSQMTLATFEGGAVMGWGANAFGQTGNGTNSGPELCPVAVTELEPCSVSPVRIGGLTGVRQVAAGGLAGYALLENGTVMAWGINQDGELGNGSTAGPEICQTRFESGEQPCSRIPVLVPGLSGVTAIAAGGRDAFALLENGTVMAWGANNAGQLGVEGEFSQACPGGEWCQPRPTPVKSITNNVLTGVTALAAGHAHTLALLENGTVVAWGSNNTGEVGDETQSDKYYAVPVSGLSGVSAIGAGSGVSVALLSDHTVKTWGVNDLGQLGIGRNTGPERCSQTAPNLACSTSPVAVPGLSGVQQVAGGLDHDLALLEDGTVMAWGDNNGGGLGVNEAGPEHCRVTELPSEGEGLYCSTRPVPVRGLTDVRTVAVGAGFEDSFAYGPLLPVVTGIEGGEPAAQAATGASGSELGGTPVQIAGTDLSGVTAVRFGDQEAPSISVSAIGQITAISPPGTGTVEVTAISPRGESTATAGNTFSYVAPGPPTVRWVSRAQGLQAGGSSVTIGGRNLRGATSVRFGTSLAPAFTVNATGTITATTPPGFGTVDVTVITPLGQSTTSSEDRFSYVAPLAPVIKTLTSTRGATVGGELIRIYGRNFTDVHSVAFGGANAESFVVEAPTVIAAVTPPGAAGPARVTIAATAGVNAATTGGTYTYYPPMVSGVSPSSGPVGGNTEVSISGAGFAAGAGTTFKFGTIVATSADCVSTSLCVVAVPKASKRGTVPVSAAVGKSRTRLINDRRYTYE